MEKVKEIALYFLWFVFGGLTSIGIAKFLMFSFRIAVEGIAKFLTWANSPNNNYKQHMLDEFTGERIFNQDNWYCPECETDNKSVCVRPPKKSTEGHL